MKKLLLSLSTLLFLQGIAGNPETNPVSEKNQLSSPTAVGEALNFDGVDDYVVATGYSTLTEYTIEAWVKLNNLNDQNIIAGTSTSGPLVHLSHTLRLVSGKFDHGLYDGSGRNVTSPVIVTAGVWYHVAISAKNNGVMKITVNNTETTSSFTFGTMWTALSQFRFGGNAMGVGFFNGELDEVRIWNRQLCLDEITTKMNGEIGGAFGNVIGNYHFNQGAAGQTSAGITTLLDDSGTNKHGTLTNFALTGSMSNWISPGGVTSGSLAPPYFMSNITITPPVLACATVPYTITASGANTYTWSVGSSTNGTLVTAQNITVPTAFTYTAIGFNLNGCPSNAEATTFTVYPKPTVSVANGYICSSSNYSITPSGAINYTYSSGSAIITPSANANFTVTGANQYGCVNSASATVFVQNCGQSGSSLSFDGVNDVVNTNVTYNNIGTNWTFECWAMGTSAPTTNKGHSGPMYGANRSIVWHHANPTFMAGASVQDANLNYFAASFGSLVPNTWYHLAATYNGTVLCAYKNGVLTNSITTGGGISSAAGNLMFGRHPSQTQFWDGAMDEARVWTTARTCAEINQFMNTELVGNEAGLYAYYNFNEGTPMGTNSSITSILDHTSNALNASISNFALTGNSSNFFLGAPFDANYSCGVTTINEVMAMEKGFRVYPNPASSQLSIITSQSDSFSMLNILGDVIKTFSIDSTEMIDVSELSSGIYFVRNNKTGTTIKFVKQ